MDQFLLKSISCGWLIVFEMLGSDQKNIVTVFHQSIDDARQGHCHAVDIGRVSLSDNSYFQAWANLAQALDVKVCMHVKSMVFERDHCVKPSCQFHDSDKLYSVSSKIHSIV
jgi:hypothetical protein